MIKTDDSLLSKNFRILIRAKLIGAKSAKTAEYKLEDLF